ncbi:MAG: hypothetical protein MZW92_74990 [Comamonadaceae bacterium]|nr:hypothetical protein [Comamonadaceae bacterium]
MDPVTEKTMQQTLFAGLARRIAAAALSLAFAAAAVPAAAQTGGVVALPATPTTIAGSETRMISYRHQNHMWQTADGWTHLLANVGPQGDGSALRMFSSGDGGVTWAPGIAVADTDGSSTADGFLAGNVLYATWAATGGRIAFASLQWDPTGRAWRVTRSETAFASDRFKAVNPSVARDGVGRFWLGFTTQDAASGEYALKMLRRTSTALGWVDSGLVFGAPDRLSNERSIRPVAVAGGVGAVWSLHGRPVLVQAAQQLARGAAVGVDADPRVGRQRPRPVRRPTSASPSTTRATCTSRSPTPASSGTRGCSRPRANGARR